MAPLEKIPSLAIIKADKVICTFKMRTMINQDTIVLDLEISMKVQTRLVHPYKPEDITISYKQTHLSFEIHQTHTKNAKSLCPPLHTNFDIRPYL